MKKLNTSSIISILFVLGILGMINAIAVRNFVRLDLTSSKMYTLSKASREMVSMIEDKVIVKAYFSPDLPSPYNNAERYLRDMLEDYRAYSKGHLDYEFIDPGTEEDLEKEAQGFNIPPQQFQSVANDKIELKKGYMGVVFIYGDKREVIPVMSNITNLEYEITSLLNRLTSIKLPVLGMASTGSEEQKVSMQQIYEVLGKNFDIRPVDLNEPVGDEFNGLFVIAPRERFSDWQLFNLDQYIINGGKVSIFANAYEAFLQQQYAQRRDLNLKGFLNNYGIGINEDLLFDEKSAAVSIPQRRGFFTFNKQIKVPFLPDISTFNRENMVTRELSHIQTFFPSSVDTSLAAEKGFEIEGLAYTSGLSGRERGPSVRLDIVRQWTKEDFNEKHVPLAAVVKGTFTSYFAETGPPKKPITVEGGDDEENTIVEVEYDGPFTAKAETENRVIVIGDGYMALDEYMSSAGPVNLLFIQNIADWLVQAENLISIRSKQLRLKPLKETPTYAKKIIKWFNQIGPVILVIVMGIILWQARRHRKKVLMMQS